MPHSYYQYKPAPQTITTWTEADAWINGGRNKDSHRKLTKQRCLWRAGVLAPSDTLYPDDIVFRLYATDIIIYHRDGTFTIRHEGITTKTTIWDIENHTPVRLYGVPGTREGRGWWASEFVIAHRTDPLTPKKVHKCRVCHGDRIVLSVCSPSRSRPYRCQFGELSWPEREWTQLIGHEWREHYLPNEHDIKWGVYRDGEDLAVGADTVLTRTHERRRRDFGFAPCWHGFLERHIEFVQCDNCGGTGLRNHGNRPIHTPFNGDGIRITADGRPIRWIEDWAEQVATLRQIRQRMQP